LNAYFVEVEYVAKRDVTVIKYMLDTFEVLVDNGEIKLLCMLQIQSRRSEKGTLRISPNEMFNPTS
jgi:hypothetical protein